MIRLIVGFILLAFPFAGSSQSHRKFENTTLRYSQLAGLLRDTRADTLIFNKVKFVNDSGTGTWAMTVTRDTSNTYQYWATVYIANSLRIAAIEGDTAKVFARDVQFNNCVFDDDLYLYNVKFPGSVSFMECYSTKNKATLLLKECTVDHYMTFNNSQTPVSNPSFWKVALELTTVDSVILHNPGSDAEVNIIDVQISNIKKYMYLSGGSVTLGGSSVNLEASSSITANDQVYIQGNTFTTFDEALLKLEITNGDFALYFNRIGAPIQINTYGDATEWEIFSNSVKARIGMYNRSEIAPTSYIDYDNILGDRPLGWHSADASGADSTFFEGTTEQLWEKRGYKRLLQQHKILHEFYVSCGDIISANKVYVRMKDLETRALLSGIDVPGSSFDTTVRIGLNKLLKFYTLYGTDPSRAILNSIWVILVFAFIYIFFPSSWDRQPKLQLIRDLRTFSERKNWSATVAGRTGVVMLLTVVNAVTLSLNSFVTLGFGDIPTRGLARYMTIIEGFVGWFLLTLFSVALISQSS